MDVDIEGIIEIGHAKDLADKIMNFGEAVSGSDSNDTEGYKLSYIYEKND